MTENQYEEDKVYLRDKRTGQIYLSERNLEQNGNFEAHVPNPSKKAKAEDDDKGKKPPAQPVKPEGTDPETPDPSKPPVQGQQ